MTYADQQTTALAVVLILGGWALTAWGWARSQVHPHWRYDVAMALGCGIAFTGFLLIGVRIHDTMTHRTATIRGLV